MLCGDSWWSQKQVKASSSAKKLFGAKPTWIKNATDFFESVAHMVHTVSILS
jgi:hypothetical protein